MNISYKKDQDTIDHLKHKIRAFNNEYSPYHKASREPGYVQPILITKKENGKLIGGLSARYYWDMIYLDEFYIDATYRKSGLGSDMLKTLIGIGQDKMAKYICLETFSFQARQFYEKFGFEVIGEIKDYPPGESMFTMRKNL